MTIPGKLKLLGVGLGSLFILPLLLAASAGWLIAVQPGGMRPIPEVAAPDLHRLPVGEFAADPARGFSLIASSNRHHPCLKPLHWMIALHSQQPVDLTDGCRPGSGRWTGLFTGRSTTDLSKITLLPAVPAHLALAAGLKDRPGDLRRWQEPSAEDAWLWIPVLTFAAGQRAGRSIENWQPSRPELACSYARRWLAAKSEFALAVRPAERAALATILARCGG